MNGKNIDTIYKGGCGGIISRVLLVLLLFGMFGCGRQDSYRVTLESDPAASYASDAKEEERLKPAENAEDDNSPKEEQVIYVHVCGAVNKAGVYACKKGDRVFQLIEAAGGFSVDACPEALNQAEQVEDGSRIYVPTTEEWEELGSQSPLQSTDKAKDDRVNINTADAKLLCTLPGIGEAKAQAILSYREENGVFQSIEEVQSVSGIGSSVYSKIKNLIKVSE